MGIALYACSHLSSVAGALSAVEAEGRQQEHAGFSVLLRTSMQVEHRKLSSCLIGPMGPHEDEHGDCKNAAASAAASFAQLVILCVLDPVPLRWPMPQAFCSRHCPDKTWSR